MHFPCLYQFLQEEKSPEMDTISPIWLNVIPHPHDVQSPPSWGGATTQGWCQWSESRYHWFFPRWEHSSTEGHRPWKIPVLSVSASAESGHPDLRGSQCCLYLQWRALSSEPSTCHGGSTGQEGAGGKPLFSLCPYLQVFELLYPHPCAWYLAASMRHNSHFLFQNPLLPSMDFA